MKWPAVSKEVSSSSRSQEGYPSQASTALVPLYGIAVAILTGTFFTVWIALSSSTTSPDCYRLNICDGLTFRVVGELLVSGETPYRREVRDAYVASTRLEGQRPPFDLPFQYPPNALPLFVLRTVGPARTNALVGAAATTLAALVSLAFLWRRTRFRLLWVSMTAFWPVLWFDAVLTQTGALAATFAVGTLALGSRFPIGSGIFLGLLAFKPHYALPLLLAAVMCQRWRTVVAALCTGIAMALLSTALWGTGVWSEAWHALQQTNETAVAMSNWMGPIAQWSPDLASRLAWPVFGFGILLVSSGIFRGSRLGWRWETLGAGALGSLLFFSPNTHPYDLVLVLPAIVLLLGNKRPWVQVVGAFATWAPGLGFLQPRHHHEWFTPLLLLVTLAWIVAVLRKKEPGSVPVGKRSRPVQG